MLWQTKMRRRFVDLNNEHSEFQDGDPLDANKRAIDCLPSKDDLYNNEWWDIQEIRDFTEEDIYEPLEPNNLPMPDWDMGERVNHKHYPWFLFIAFI